jgi:hypothetical protein
MTDEPIDRTPTKSESPEAGPKPTAPEIGFGRLPGLLAIALYMLLLAGTVILGVAMKNYPPFYLVFPALFIASGLGLLMMFRWAWALSLAAVVLLMAAFLYEFAAQHAAFGLVQGVLNLVFFLYLVRAEVREKLR